MIRNPISHKNIKFFYYLKGTLLEGLRKLGDKGSREKWLRIIDSLDQEVIEERLQYYSKNNESFSYDGTVPKVGDFELPKKNSAYYFDLLEFARYFPNEVQLKYQFGDVREVPEIPTLVKSRPILENNENALLFKFNRIRHFTFVNDRVAYQKKKNLLIGRASVKQEHRREFLRQYFNHPLCDLGQINSGTQHDEWLKKKITINDHLQYKFVWCQEGNDVASNLKWVMSSNSIAVMPEPSFETWFMEGTLKPNIHYIAIKKDFSDLEERLRYYLAHEKEALEIRDNANAYIKKFKNSTLEKALCFLVLDKLIAQSGQIKPLFPKWY